MQCFQTKEYVEEYVFRPDYPDELYTTIMEYLGEKLKPTGVAGKYPLAIDVACGTGNSTFPLLKYFDKVVGIDPSDTMLEGAKEKAWSKEVRFRKACAEDLAAEDDSAYLITVGTALHWFNDFGKFYKEVDRVLAPGGVVVAYCAFLRNLEVIKHPNSSQLSPLLVELAMTPINKGYVKGMEVAVTDYTEECCQIPYADRQRCDSVTIEVETTLGGLLGYGKSLNAFALMEENEPEWTRNWFDGLKERFLAACETTNLNFPITKKVTFFMIMGRKPSGNN